jgi:4-oxalocrotonate tautomerase
MPLLQVSLIEGRTTEQKHELIAQLTETVVRVLDAPREAVRVIINEVPPEHWGVGGVPRSAAAGAGTQSERSSQ